MPLIKIDHTKVLEYFDNHAYPDKANQLHSFSAARSIFHLAVEVEQRSRNYPCFCFKCKLCRILLTTLLSRRHQKILRIVKKDNHLIIFNLILSK